MNNKKFEYTPERIFSGTFPIEQTEVLSETAIAVGDIIGVSGTHKFGKLGTGYPTAYGVVYTIQDVVPGKVNIILTGSLHTDFVNFDTAKEVEQTQQLRVIGIFVK